MARSEAAQSSPQSGIFATPHLSYTITPSTARLHQPLPPDIANIMPAPKSPSRMNVADVLNADTSLTIAADGRIDKTGEQGPGISTEAEIDVSLMGLFSMDSTDSAGTFQAVAGMSFADLLNETEEGEAPRTAPEVPAPSDGPMESSILLGGANEDITPLKSQPAQAPYTLSDFGSAFIDGWSHARFLTRATLPDINNSLTARIVHSMQDAHPRMIAVHIGTSAEALIGLGISTAGDSATVNDQQQEDVTLLSRHCLLLCPTEMQEAMSQGTAKVAGGPIADVPERYLPAYQGFPLSDLDDIKQAIITSALDTCWNPHDPGDTSHHILSKEWATVVPDPSCLLLRPLSTKLDRNQAETLCSATGLVGLLRHLSCDGEEAATGHRRWTPYFQVGSRIDLSSLDSDTRKILHGQLRGV